jgi:PKHD-type hydroxylase
MTTVDVPPQVNTPAPFYVLQPQWRQNYADYCWFESAFTPDEVRRIIELSEEFPPEEATVGNYRAIDGKIRSSIVRWVHPNANNLWFFDRLVTLVGTCNQQRYGFELTGLNEGLQVAEYRPGGFFSWHKDHGPDAHSIRKLSVTVQLSDPGDYDGGDMEFLAGPRAEVAPKALGTAIIFPSYVMHRVMSIERGSRRSVVGWFSGPPYR